MSSRETDAIMVMVALEAPDAWVWNALTDQDILRRWWASDLQLDIREGGEFSMPWTNEASAVCVARGTVLELVPRRRLRLSWSAEGWPQPTEVTFDMIPLDGWTQVTIHHSGWHEVPDSGQWAEEYRQGWTQLLDRLKVYLSNS